MGELMVGPNKHDRTPHELADLLEGNSRIDPGKIDLNHIDYDVNVLVIGCGGAGASAALLAQENGANVLLVTKLRLGDANTVGAQGGTQAADRPSDSPVTHYLDTMGGGHFANIPELVEALVKDAPSVIKWLESLGVNWDKEPDGSMRVLRDEVKNRNIKYLEFSPAIELRLYRGCLLPVSAQEACMAETGWAATQRWTCLSLEGELVKRQHIMPER